MDVVETAMQLKNQFQNEDWYNDIIVENSKLPHKIIVYTNRQTLDILNSIPVQLNNYQILVHFANRPISKLGALWGTNPVPSKEVISQFIKTTETDLVKELDRLEKICGAHSLESIFYEIQDKQNAVTNLSERYPDVRKSLEYLFNVYGFNAIFNELET